MADDSLGVPRWFLLLSNHVTSWVDGRAGAEEPFTRVEQERNFDTAIYSPGREWHLTRTTQGALLMWDDDHSGTVSISFPKERAEPDVIAILQAYADRHHAERLAEVLA